MRVEEGRAVYRGVARHHPAVPRGQPSLGRWQDSQSVLRGVPKRRDDRDASVPGGQIAILLQKRGRLAVLRALDPGLNAVLAHLPVHPDDKRGRQREFL